MSKGSHVCLNDRKLNEYYNCICYVIFVQLILHAEQMHEIPIQKVSQSNRRKSRANKKTLSAKVKRDFTYWPSY